MFMTYIYWLEYPSPNLRIEAYKLNSMVYRVERFYTGGARDFIFADLGKDNTQVSRDQVLDV